MFEPLSHHMIATEKGFGHWSDATSVLLSSILTDQTLLRDERIMAQREVRVDMMV
jgi:hypothetical protein